MKDELAQVGKRLHGEPTVAAVRESVVQRDRKSGNARASTKTEVARLAFEMDRRTVDADRSGS